MVALVQTKIVKHGCGSRTASYDGIHIERVADLQVEDRISAWRLTGVRQGTFQR